MKEIKLTNSDKVVKIDDKYYELISKYTWRINTNGYAMSTKWLDKYKTRAMHRYIMKVYNSKIYIDHINHNKLDNQEDNLRLADSRINTINRKKQVGNFTSKYKGVSYNKKSNSYRVYVHLDNGTKYGGSYDNEYDAARCYNYLTFQLHGKESYLNDIEGWENFQVADIRKRKSQYYGVYYVNRDKTYYVRVKINNIYKYICAEPDEIKAAKIYDQECRKRNIHLDKLNFPSDNTNESN
jgi:ribosomal protein L21E